MKTTVTEVDPADLDVATDTETSDDAGGPQERTFGPRIKLTVEVDEETFDDAIDQAFRKIAKEIKIPGFRKGKVPRPVLESHIGSEYARAQALEDAIPGYYAEAVRAEAVDVIAAPELSLTSGEDHGSVCFEAVVETRPQIDIRGYENLKVEIPHPAPSDEEVQEQIDTQRRQSAELVDVDRSAASGDQVSIDIQGTVEGEALPGLTADDYLYSVGSGGIVDEVDLQLEGSSAGDELSFSADHPVQEGVTIDFKINVKAVKEEVHPELTDEWVEDNTEHDTVDDYLYSVGSGGIVDEVDLQLEGSSAGDELSFSADHPVQEDVTIDFKINVNAVKEEVLPELTDEWVEDNTEHDTVDELRSETMQRMRMMRIFQTNAAMRENTATAVAELVNDDIPDSMVNGEMSEQLQQLAMRLQGQGMNIETWMQMTGQDPESFTVELRDAAQRSAKVDLALRSIVEKESVEVDDDELEEELERMAEQFQTTVHELRHQIEDHGDGLGPLLAEIGKRKALEWLVAEVELIDNEGNTIDRDDLDLPDLSGSDDDHNDSEEDVGATVESAEVENEDHSEEDDKQ